LRAWLEEALSNTELPEDAIGYLLRRGAKPETYTKMGVTVWQAPEAVAPDQSRKDRYGPRWEKLQGRLAIPLVSPAGKVIGVEFRGMEQKKLDRYLLPEAEWNPVWHMIPGSVEALWAGRPAWLVEGAFDMYAMEWAAPGDGIFAVLRAALSRKQIEFLRRFASFVNVCFDRDKPGLEGMHGGKDKTGKFHPGALYLLRKAEIACAEVVFRGGKDPGELWDARGRDMTACFGR
jgi:DNA primase